MVINDDMLNQMLSCHLSLQINSVLYLSLRKMCGAGISTYCKTMSDLSICSASISDDLTDLVANQ